MHSRQEYKTTSLRICIFVNSIKQHSNGKPTTPVVNPNSRIQCTQSKVITLIIVEVTFPTWTLVAGCGTINMPYTYPGTMADMSVPAYKLARAVEKREVLEGKLHVLDSSESE